MLVWKYLEQKFSKKKKAFLNYSWVQFRLEMHWNLKSLYDFLYYYNETIYIIFIWFIWSMYPSPKPSLYISILATISGRNDNKKVQHQKTSIYKENTLTDIEFVKCKRSQLLCTEYSSCIFYHRLLLQNRQKI